MSRGINKVILVGNLGQDPDVRWMQNGKAVANLRIATSDSWTKDGEKQERTEWHSVVLFEKLGEIAGEYLRKGSQVYIEGSLRTRKWQDKEGKDRYTTEIVAREIQMLGKAPNESQAPSEAGEQRQWPAAAPGSRTTTRAKPGTIEGNLARNATSDDVPFDDIDRLPF